MPRILAPHKEQDGWVYARVARCEAWFARFLDLDYSPERRIISSRRVEEAVETMDYLKRCADEDLDVRCWGAVFNGEKEKLLMNDTGLWWVVWKPSRKKAMPNGSPTLREAYHRYKNANGQG